MHTDIQSATKRIASIDLLRGAVMIIMALDHVRDYFHIGMPDPTDLQQTTPVLFFTRWITHFCAPTFLLLSGVSAYLSGRKKTPSELSTFLLKRGAWLVLIEVTIVSLGWTFNPLLNVVILQVIWAIGISMIILGLLLMINAKLVPLVGIILFLFHNLTDYFPLINYGWTFFLTSTGTFINYAPQRGIFDFYAILPWTAILLLGYSIGKWFTAEYTQAQRQKRLFITGGILLVLFFALRFINLYGDPNPWKAQATTTQTILSFFKVTKYPCSLIYGCMTLGSAMLALGLMEHAKGKVTSVISIYGRVPFFYYILHLYLIHLGASILYFASGRRGIDMDHMRAFFLFTSRDVGVGLGGVYLIWITVVAILYLPCRWYDQYKKAHRHWWLSYL